MRIVAANHHSATYDLEFSHLATLEPFLMASIPCPNCGTHVQKPTNIIGIILGIFGFLFIGGTLLIIICLATIATVGANADARFDEVGAELNEVDFDSGAMQIEAETSQDAVDVQ